MATPLPTDEFGPDLEQLANLGALRTAREDYIPNIQSAYGAIIQNAPDYQYFTAPLSNRGRTTASYGTQNNLVVAPNTPIRVVDNKTGNVIYSGTGYEGAQAAIEAAKALSASGGSKANWDIQVTRPGGSKFESVSTERPDDMVGKIAGMALPIAVGLIPGLQGVGAVLASTAAGAAGSAIAGNDPLKGAIMGGLSAAGGQLLGGPLKNAGLGLNANAARAVGTGIGATAGGLATGRDLGSSLLGGVTSGGLSYLSGELMGGGKSPNGGETGGGQIGDSGVELGDIVVTGRIPAFSGTAFSPSFFDKAQVNNEAVDRSIAQGGIGGSGVELEPGDITVTGTRGIPNFSGTSFSPSFFDTASDFAVKPEELAAAEDVEPTDDEIIVSGRGTTPTGSSTFSVGPNVKTDFEVPEEIIVEAQKTAEPDLTSSTLAVGGPDVDVDPDFPDEIKVTAKKIEEPAPSGGPLTIPGDVTVPKDILDAAEKADATDADKKGGFGVEELLLLLGLLGGAGGGGGGGGTGTAGTGKFQPIFSAKLPTPGEGGALKIGGLKGPVTGAAGTFSARPTTDWYRFGMGPAMDIPAGTDLSAATSPYAGYGPGTLGEETFRAVSGIPEEPPVTQPTGMYAGGSMGYSRGSSRESFAVNGPGTGRSDDIPAVLSDGEYVIDAETVAMLGDGSSKAGAKRLDEMRVNIRKHKGRNLAKGKFSVNAKRPEKYLSGGRV